MENKEVFLLSFFDDLNQALQAHIKDHQIRCLCQRHVDFSSVWQQKQANTLFSHCDMAMNLRYRQRKIKAVSILTGYLLYEVSAKQAFLAQVFLHRFPDNSQKIYLQSPVFPALFFPFVLSLRLALCQNKVLIADLAKLLYIGYFLVPLQSALH